jgi:hypothetical protein
MGSNNLALAFLEKAVVVRAPRGAIAGRVLWESDASSHLHY